MRKLKFLFVVLCLARSGAWADKVIMKDGKVYEGKILDDFGKALLIGNPPYDTKAHLLRMDDIQTIVYEEYRPPPPAQRRQGFTVATWIQGTAYSSQELPLYPATSLAAEVGYRLHPFVELDGEINWTPSVSAHGDGLLLSDSVTTRGYEHFWAYSPALTVRFYPLAQNKKQVTEPYLLGGYAWSHLIPKGSGDALKGTGWHIGAGVMHPCTTHFFLDSQLVYERLGYDSANFLGRTGDLSPAIVEHRYLLSIGLSYRP